MTPWWLFALTFAAGALFGGTVGAFAMAVIQINKLGDDRDALP
jgi:hypothetical protein